MASQWWHVAVSELHYVVTHEEVIQLQEIIMSPRLPLNDDIWHSQSLVVITQLEEYLAYILSSDGDLWHGRKTVDGSVHRN